MQTSVVDYLRQNSESFPDKIAVNHQDKEYSYSEIWSSAEKISEFLRQNGLSKGDRVALLIENSFEYIAVYYGALLAGAIVVPLNTAAKSGDLSNWISHSGSKSDIPDLPGCGLGRTRNRFGELRRSAILGLRYR